MESFFRNINTDEKWAKATKNISLYILILICTLINIYK